MATHVMQPSVVLGIPGQIIRVVGKGKSFSPAVAHKPEPLFVMIPISQMDPRVRSNMTEKDKAMMNGNYDGLI